MSELDDRTLVRGPETGQPDETPSRRGPILLIAIVGLVLGAAGAWWWARDRAPETAEATPPATAAPPAPAAPVTDDRPPLPELNQMDTFLRALLGTLSSSPELARWLATDDLIRQMAHGVDRVSRGASPAPDLAVLKPTGSFAPSGRGNAMAIDPAAYRRFDGLAAAVASLDAQGVAAAYRTIQPRLEEAYRGLGRTQGSVDTALAAALQNLIATPDVEGPIRIIPGAGASYAYADPKLQQLQPAQKQLLRMGPENAARVKAKLREIQAAIQAQPGQ